MHEVFPLDLFFPFAVDLEVGLLENLWWSFRWQYHGNSLADPMWIYYIHISKSKRCVSIIHKWSKMNESPSHLRLSNLLLSLVCTVPVQRQELWLDEILFLPETKWMKWWKNSVRVNILHEFAFIAVFFRLFELNFWVKLNVLFNDGWIAFPIDFRNISFQSNTFQETSNQSIHTLIAIPQKQFRKNSITIIRPVWRIESVFSRNCSQLWNTKTNPRKSCVMSWKVYFYRSSCVILWQLCHISVWMIQLKSRLFDSL